MAEPPREEPWDLGLEDEEFWMNPSVARVLQEAERLADRIAGRVAELRRILEEEPSVRTELGGLERGVLGEEPPLPGAAVDSTFPIDGGVDLVGGHLVAIVAGYVSFAGACVGGEACHDSFAKAWFVSTEEAVRQVPLRAKALEKAVTLRLLRMLRDGGPVRPRMILLDGEVIPYQLLFKSSRAVARSRALTKLDELTSRVLREARELGVTLIGVVKRSYSRLLAARIGRRLPLNDKAVMSMLLRPGEYTVLGRFRELLPAYAEVLAEEKHLDPRKYRRVVEERLAERSLYGDTVVAFYRPGRMRRGGYAVRVEVLDYGGVGLERLLSMLNRLTNPATGLPYPVDVVDSYTALEARVLELLRRRVVALLARLVPDRRALVVMAHTNPEKRFIYEPRRARR